jgi:hypothetical protein
MEPSELAAALLTAASAATYVSVQGCFHVAQLLRQRRARAEGSPSVTILKPMSGHDYALADNLSVPGARCAAGPELFSGVLRRRQVVPRAAIPLSPNRHRGPVPNPA